MKNVEAANYDNFSAFERIELPVRKRTPTMQLLLNKFNLNLYNKFECNKNKIIKRPWFFFFFIITWFIIQKKINISVIIKQTRDNL